MKEKLFATEADLCDAFMTWARQQGWTPYPETCGWDILLVSPDGHQCGVEAKLRLNLKVISQVMPAQYDLDVGPDHRAILVPEAHHGACELLVPCGVEVFTCAGTYNGRTGTHIWFRRHLGDKLNAMFDWNQAKRHELPEYMPTGRAGVPSPIQLTAWKLGALRIMALLERNGFVTRDDFRAARIDPRRWCASDGWLVPVPGKRGCWARGSVPRFDEQHPEVYAEIKAKLEEGSAT